MLQLTQLLYLVAKEVDGKRDFAQIAERVTEEFGRTVSADNVEFLVEKKLRPIGVLARADGTNPKLKKADPMLALNVASDNSIAYANAEQNVDIDQSNL